ncbi:hypothetical protein GOP47_0006607 [Adiantum capillus-veneris]|uniref:Uncharacterized protein n=1 Tax=Adiantum capillus-veneris TaxID=13818 RepID=A0A9D4V3Y4_ADICA|nr:hypothetical protein GOP47_0006607 [Adiantum capillus-veneris]
MYKVLTLGLVYGPPRSRERVLFFCEPKIKIEPNVAPTSLSPLPPKKESEVRESKAHRTYSVFLKRSASQASQELRLAIANHPADLLSCIALAFKMEESYEQPL